MDACGQVTTLLGAMVEAIRSDAGVEQGFILCRMPSGDLQKGTTCGGDGDPNADTHRCSTPQPYCPEGGVPAVSFHTHPTVLPGKEAPRGEAAKAFLIPSVKDFVADKKIGVDVGCIGGKLNEGRGFVWCFPRKRGLEVAVHGVWESIAKGQTSLLEHLARFYHAVGDPCLEAYFPIEHEHDGEPCPTCGTKVVHAMTVSKGMAAGREVERRMRDRLRKLSDREPTEKELSTYIGVEGIASIPGELPPALDRAIEKEPERV